MKNLLILVSFALALYLESCSEKKSVATEKKLEEIRTEKQDSLKRSEAITSLCRKHGATFWDTGLFLESPYTFQYQSKLEKNNKIVLTDFHVFDIERIDTSYSLTIKVGGYGTIFFKMPCQLNDVNYIIPQPDSVTIVEPEISLDKVYLVMSVTSIKKASFTIGTTCDDSKGSLELEDGPVFFAKGALLEVVRGK